MPKKEKEVLRDVHLFILALLFLNQILLYNMTLI